MRSDEAMLAYIANHYMTLCAFDDGEDPELQAAIAKYGAILDRAERARRDEQQE